MRKKIILSYISVAFLGELYTPGSTPSGPHQNMHLNAFGSKYANIYGHGETSKINRETKALIYDATPEDFFDLKILSMTPALGYTSDEITYHEIGFGRKALIIGDTSAGVPAGSVQTVPVLNPEEVSIDTIVHYPRNDATARGTVTAVDLIANTVTITAQTGMTLPALVAGDTGKYFANIAPVEADAVDKISQYYDIDTVERCNYIQLLVKAIRFGRVELIKYKANGSLSNYLAMKRSRMVQQFRIDISNIYWNGNMAEVKLANNVKAKTAGGVFPIMQRSGAPYASVTIANAPLAIENMALNTQFKSYGSTKFLYATPRVLHWVAQEYKRPLTRYTPDNDIAKLKLDMIDMGSTKIVFVPVQRFEELFYCSYIFLSLYCI